MSLPDLIEIVPLTKPVQAQITVPGSKSITNRALILAALGQGKTTLHGALWSEDTQVMVECLKKLGFNLTVQTDPDEFCNRTISVEGLGGKIPKGGTPTKPLELFVGNAGTAARFLSAFVCLGKGVYRLHGVLRMHVRPQASLFEALRALGYRVDSSDNKLPATIHGSGPLSGACEVSIDESSQFASALLLSAGIGGWKVRVVGQNADESPYVTMTERLIKSFPTRGGAFQIEPDASSGSYFWAVGWLINNPALSGKARGVRTVTTAEGKERDILAAHVKKGPVIVMDWPTSGWQMDSEFAEFLDFETQALPAKISRLNELGDSIMTAIVLAPFAWRKSVKFTDLGRLRVQECERVTALRTELNKCGANVVESGDTLTVTRSRLHGAEIETYNDHRMAMCFAVLGLKVPGIKIRNPACVKKTFPNFFQKLAAAPPHGLGAKILDAKTGRELSHDELFAD